MHNFKIGDRVYVEILPRGLATLRLSYNGKAMGKKGTVAYTLGAKIGVVIDGQKNPNSSKGWFYFESYELRHENKQKTEEMKMHKMKNYLNVAEVSFCDGANTNKIYRYACYDPDVQVGDTCVVASAHHGLGVAKVISLAPPVGDEELYREIVGRVDTSAYRARVANRLLAAETEAAMKKMSEKLQTISLYEAMAKYSPEMAELLEKYKALPET